MSQKNNPAHLISIWEALGLLLAIVMTAGFMYQQYRAQQQLIVEQHTMALDVAYRATIETYRLDVETRFRLQVMRPEILDIMEEALTAPPERLPVLRGKLFRQLKPVYDELQKIGLRQFQFHLADDRSFLRFHMPHMANDPLFELRPSLRIANIEKRPVAGLEVGRTQPGFRYVFPIAKAGRHLGSVELSLPFENIQTNLSHLLDKGDFGLLLLKDAVLGRVVASAEDKYVEAPLHPDYLIENPTISRVARNFEQSTIVRELNPILRADRTVQASLHQGESVVIPLIHHAQGYTVSFLAIPDLNGNRSAYIVRYAQTDSLHELRNGLIRQGILAGLLVLALAAAFLWLHRQRQQLRDDIARREIAESSLRLYERIFNESGDAILVTDHANRIMAVNPAFIALTGYALDDIRGRNPHILSSGQTMPETYQALWAGLKTTGHWQGELIDRRKDGSIYPKWTSISDIRDTAGNVTHYIASFFDISERKAAEAHIERLAHHDQLTGLLNRYSLESRLEQGLLSARRENQRVAVLFIDMDRFKHINDTLGHHMGDALLQEVARRLQACVRESDIVARQGGDEFVVALTGLPTIHDVAPVANKLLRTLGENYKIEGYALHSSPSIGIALFPNDGDTVDALLKNADMAMYSAKEKGRNNVQYFTAAMTAAAGERLEIEHDLHAALANQEFEIHYQPQVLASDRHICGVEALVRWRHPTRGLVPPDRFISIAEEAGLIEAIGSWVLNEACRQLAAWQKQDITGLCMAVNLSAHQLRSASLVTQVSACMTRHGIAAGELELEVTESVAMESPEQAIGTLRALRDLGVRLAIDDFGTGYSSLAYLKHLPIHTIKLDRSFVRDLETDANDASICAATVTLAHALGLSIVAEGVETIAQAEFLGTQHGCDILQGYLFSRPEPPETLVERLRKRLCT